MQASTFHATKRPVSRTRESVRRQGETQLWLDAMSEVYSFGGQTLAVPIRNTLLRA